MKEVLVKIGKWCWKYVSLIPLVFIVYIIYMNFFNESSVNSDKLEDKIKELNAKIEENKDTFEYYKQKLHSLSTNPETMERVVREYYHMQRPTEDVYVFDNNPR